MVNAKYYELYPKGGRPPRFTKPQELWDAALTYFRWCDDNPIPVATRKQASKKSNRRNGDETQAKQLDEVAPRPYTLYGLCAYINIPKWHTFKDNYETKKGFAEMCERIENIVTAQQVDGGMVGLYDARLTARINGIAEHTDVTTNGKSVVQQKSTEELQTELDELRRKTEDITNEHPIGFKQSKTE